MRLQSLEKDVGRDFEERVRNKEDRQRQVVLRSRKIQVRFKLPSDPILRKRALPLEVLHSQYSFGPGKIGDTTD
jgi:hypothetical protein